MGWDADVVDQAFRSDSLPDGRREVRSDDVVAVWGEVLWLVRLARLGGQVTDEFALAALIDVEVELEQVHGVEEALPLAVSMPAAEAIGRALVLIRGRAGLAPVIEGWLAEALRLVAKP